MFGSLIRASIAVVAAVLLFSGCNSDSSRGKSGKKYTPNSVGGPYELVVVADHPEWDGAVGDTLRAMFYKKFPMISREETTVTVLRTLPSGFEKLIERHKNVLIVDIDEKYTAASLSLRRDVYAKPQLVLVASAPDERSLLELIDSGRDNIMLSIETAEKDRDVADAAVHTPKKIQTLIGEKFGIEMGMGPGYTVRSEGAGFLWLSYELPTSSQGIVIYTYPLSGVEDFDRENLLRRRTEFVSRIPGENPGSHMSTNTDYVGLTYKKIDGRQWAEMRGFWDVEGDFMGGPYRNYSAVAPDGRSVLAIDFYVYSPDHRQSQRNYIKQLEHYLYTVKFPAPAQTPTPTTPAPAPTQN